MHGILWITFEAMLTAFVQLLNILIKQNKKIKDMSSCKVFFHFKKLFVWGFSKPFTKHSSVTVSVTVALQHRHVKTPRTEKKSGSMIITMCVWRVLEVEAQIWDEISNPLGFTVYKSQTYCYVSVLHYMGWRSQWQDLLLIEKSRNTAGFCFSF